jgi:hypothetical protein
MPALPYRLVFPDTEAVAPAAAPHHGLAHEAASHKDGPHLTAKLVPTPAGCPTVILAGRATSVPFTAVLTSPERTPTDNTTAAMSCNVPYLRR